MSETPKIQIDSYRFLDGITRRMVKTWVSLGKPADIPWTAFTRPLSESTIAMISSGGFALKADQPFDQDFGLRGSGGILQY